MEIVIASLFQAPDHEIFSKSYMASKKTQFPLMSKQNYHSMLTLKGPCSDGPTAHANLGLHFSKICNTPILLTPLKLQTKTYVYILYFFDLFTNVKYFSLNLDIFMLVILLPVKIVL